MNHKEQLTMLTFNCKKRETPYLAQMEFGLGLLNMDEAKFVMVGDSGTGKTRFVCCHFPTCID